MSSLEEVMSYLFKRYGSPNAIMGENLDSLEQLGTPTTDEKLEKFTGTVKELKADISKNSQRFNDFVSVVQTNIFDSV